MSQKTIYGALSLVLIVVGVGGLVIVVANVIKPQYDLNAVVFGGVLALIGFILSYFFRRFAR